MRRSPMPRSPMPQTPMPQTPIPQTPMPQTPMPQTRDGTDPDAQDPDAPDPDAPVPDTPDPDTPDPDTPDPDTPDPDAPDPDAPDPDAPDPGWRRSLRGSCARRAAEPSGRYVGTRHDAPRGIVDVPMLTGLPCETNAQRGPAAQFWGNRPSPGPRAASGVIGMGVGCGRSTAGGEHRVARDPVLSTSGRRSAWR